MTWQEVINDHTLQNLPYKIELNEQGKIVMSPATNMHGILQMMIGSLLMQLLKSGSSISECSIQPRKNVKVADVAWMSSEFYKEYKRFTPFPVAPEICVEITSPSNTQDEMLEKLDLYLEQGAREVWFCNLQGTMTFYNKNGTLTNSELVSEFPLCLEV